MSANTSIYINKDQVDNLKHVSVHDSLINDLLNEEFIDTSFETPLIKNNEKLFSQRIVPIIKSLNSGEPLYMDFIHKKFITNIVNKLATIVVSIKCIADDDFLVEPPKITMTDITSIGSSLVKHIYYTTNKSLIHKHAKTGPANINVDVNLHPCFETVMFQLFASIIFRNNFRDLLHDYVYLAIIACKQRDFIYLNAHRPCVVNNNIRLKHISNQQLIDGFNKILSKKMNNNVVHNSLYCNYDMVYHRISLLPGELYDNNNDY